MSTEAHKDRKLQLCRFIEFNVDNVEVTTDERDRVFLLIFDSTNVSTKWHETQGPSPRGKQIILKLKIERKKKIKMLVNIETFKYLFYLSIAFLFFNKKKKNIFYLF